MFIIHRNVDYYYCALVGISVQPSFRRTVQAVFSKMVLDPFESKDNRVKFLTLNIAAVYTS